LPPCVLYVEDHDDTLDVIFLLLGARGFVVVGAATFAEGRRLASARDFDLFILDSKLPDGSGLDLCRELRSSRPEVPVIVYSADVRDADHEMAAAAGACLYIDKPRIDQLVEAVARLVAEAAQAVPSEASPH
jgi:two-component system phosphate regulon response regulator OmpR